MDRIYEDTMSLLLECLSLIIKAGAGGGGSSQNCVWGKISLNRCKMCMK